MSDTQETCKCDVCRREKPVTSGVLITYRMRARFICDDCTDDERNNAIARDTVSPLPF